MLRGEKEIKKNKSRVSVFIISAAAPQAQEHLFLLFLSQCFAFTLLAFVALPGKVYLGGDY